MSEEISESSLSRVYSKMKTHNVGMISAFRDGKTTKQNKQNNLSLKAKLLSDGFNITRIFGNYIENYGSDDAVEVTEESYFVVETDKSPSIFEKLPVYARAYDQDSIFLKPVGEQGYLLGVNDRTNAFPPKGDKVVVGNPVMGQEGEFFSRVKNRPFTMKEACEIELPPTLSGRWAMFKYRDLNVE